MQKPVSSEWGKLSAGQSYGVRATDVERAIFGAKWGQYELIMIQYVMEHSWGSYRARKGRDHYPDPLPCKPNFNALANLLRMPRQRLYEARDSLKAKRFLIETPEGLWVNKNADEWIDPVTGKPLLTSEYLAYALVARSRKHDSDKQESVTPQRDKMSHSSVTSDEVLSHSSVTRVTPQRDKMSHSSVTSHIEERACGDLEIQEREEKTPPTPQGGSGGAEPFIPDQNPPQPVEPEPDVRNDPAEVDRVAAKAERLFPMREFGRKVREVRGDWPMAWVSEALDLAHASGRNDWRYILGILRRFQAQGGPDKPVANGRASPSRADPVPEYHQISPERRAYLRELSTTKRAKR